MQNLLYYIERKIKKICKIDIRLLREKDKKKAIKIGRHIKERQIDRKKADRKIDKYTDKRQIERQIVRQIERKIEKQIDRQIEI